MENILQVDAAAGVAEELQPFLQKHLTESGYAIIKVKPSKTMEESMWSIAVEAGPMIEHSFRRRIRSVGYHIMESAGEVKKLPIHTEGAPYQHGLIPFLAIGCIVPATTGGETRVFDGRKAAELIDQTPGLSETMIEYSTLTTPEIGIVRPLVVPGHGRVVRYRGQVASNRIVHSPFREKAELYRQVEEKLEQCVVLELQWKAGYLLFLNNMTTLHNRSPFPGYRKMIRIRFNDENYPRFCYL